MGKENPMADLAVKAARPGSRVRRPKTFSDGRVCDVDECSTVISKYNRAEFCFQHRPVKYPRMRGVFSDEFETERA